PYYVRARSGQPLAFAGLWESWTGPNGEEMETAAIVTTRANHSLKSIHERMPVIVPPEAFNLWLDCANVDAETAAGLIAPASDDLLEAYEVSTAVNRTANDDPGLVERYTAPAEIESVTPVSTPRVPAKRAKKRDDGQGALF
ncbi:MAG: SOS response-associated peptidase family protein, partial [Pseudolabrys sp.]